jgi:tetratricopeptide (TPR) repeat protein
MRRDQVEEAGETLHDAYFKALRVGNDELALRAALWLMEFESTVRERQDFYELWAELARVLLDRHPGGFPVLAADFADTLSWNAYRHDELELAQSEARRGLELLDEAEVDAPVRRVALQLDAGAAAYAMGDLAAADADFRGALATAESAFGRDSPQITGALNNLAFTVRAEGRHDEARELLERAVEIREGELGPKHALVGRTLSNLADLELELGNGLGALAAAERAHRILAERRGEDHFATVLARQRLGLAHGLIGEYEPALEHLRAAREQAELQREPDLVAEILAEMAALEAAAGDEAASRRAVLEAAKLGPGVWPGLFEAARYARTLEQDAVARVLLEQVERSAAGTVQQKSGSRSLAEARLLRVQLILDDDPDAAAELLTKIDAAEFAGAPNLLEQLEAARSRLEVGDE